MEKYKCLSYMLHIPEHLSVHAVVNQENMLKTPSHCFRQAATQKKRPGSQLRLECHGAYKW